MKQLLTFFVLTLSLNVFAATPSSTFIVGTCESGTQFTDLKDALDHVKDIPGAIGGHTIRVCPGTYDFGRRGYDLDGADFVGLTIVGTSNNKADVVIESNRKKKTTLRIYENDVTLRYLTIKGDYRGVHTNASNTSLSDITVISQYAGIYVEKSGDLSFENINIESTKGHGIYLAKRADGDFNFSNISITAYQDAIQVLNGHDLTFDVLDLSSVVGQGLNLGSDISGDVVISNATIVAKDEAISLDDGASLTVSNSVLTSSDDIGVSLAYRVSGVKRFENVQITAKDEALKVENGTVELINSSFSSTAKGHAAVGLAYNASGAHLIQRSTFSSASGNAFEMERGSGSIIEYNDFIDSKKGLKIDRYNASNITLRHNKFANNSDVGLDLDGSSNSIYQNCFINNDNADIQRSGNVFYLGTQGNYWGNSFNLGYSQICADGNDDNICDVPYTALDNVIDQYPLKSLECGVDTVIEPLPEPNYIFQVKHSGFAVVGEYTPIEVRVLNEDGTLKTDFVGTIQLSTGINGSDWDGLAGNNGQAVYTFTADDEGYAVFLVKFDNAHSAVDIDVTDGRATDDDNEGALVVSNKGLLIGEPVYKHNSNQSLISVNPNISPKLAGQTFTLAIDTQDSLLSYNSGGLLKSLFNTVGNLLNSSACVGTTYSMVFWAESDIANQNSSNKVMVNGQPIPFGAENLSRSDVQSMCFNDLAEIDVKYKDVGKVRIFAKGIAEDNILGLKLNISGVSDLLSAILGQPRSIYGVSSYFINYPRLTATRTDKRVTALTSDGEVFEQADKPFNVRVSAVDAEGDVTPSFEQLSAQVTLQPIQVLGENIPELKVQTNTDGDWVDSVSASQIAAGSTEFSNVRWPEVGAIKIQPMLNDFYQIPYLDIGSEGYKDDNYQLDIFGRFIPNHFEILETEDALIEASCQDDQSSFQYYGQPMGFTSAPSLSIKACATEDNCVPAKNYQGALWKAGEGAQVEYVLSFEDLLGNDITGDLIDPEGLESLLGTITPAIELGDTVSFLSHPELVSDVLTSLADTTQTLNDAQQSVLSSVLGVSSVTENLGLSDLTSTVLDSVTNTLNAAGEIELIHIHQNGLFAINPLVSMNSPEDTFVFNQATGLFDYSSKALFNPMFASIEMKVSVTDSDLGEPTKWTQTFPILMKQGRWAAVGDLGAPNEAMSVKFKVQHWVAGNWEDSSNENCSSLSTEQLQFVSGFDGANNQYEYQPYGTSTTAEIPLLTSARQNISYTNGSVALKKPQATGQTVSGKWVEVSNDPIYKYSLNIFEPVNAAVGYVEVEALLDDDSWLKYPSRYELDPTTLSDDLSDATLLIQSVSAHGRGVYRQPIAPVLSSPNVSMPVPSSSVMQGPSSSQTATPIPIDPSTE